MAKDVENFFKCFLVPRDSSIDNSLCISAFHSLIGLLGWLVLNFLSYLYVLNNTLLLDVGLVKNFSQFVDSHSVLLIVSLSLQVIFSLMMSYLIIYHRSLAVGFLLRKVSPIPMSSKLLSIFFY